MVLTACGASTDDDGIGCSYDETVAGVTVSGKTGSKPIVTVGEEAQPASELLIQDLCEGTGPQASGAPEEVATADYMGVALSTGIEFDNSYDRGAPLELSLGSVIPGWQQGMAGMKVGGTRLLIIPADLGYGEFGSPPVIGPNETLIFVIDLLDVQN